MDNGRTGEHLDLVTRRLRAVAGLGTMAFLTVAAAYWNVQIAQGTRYRQQAENNRLRRASIQAPRGVISDRHGRLLVENVPSYNLLLDRSVSADVDASLSFAASILERDDAEVAALMERYRDTPAFKPILIGEDLTLSQVARFEVAELKHPEFQVEVRQRRLYRHGPQISHLLGYLGEVSKAEVQEGLPSGGLAGREGIEQTYDRSVRGQDGEREMVVDSRGKLIEEFSRVAAVPGQSLELTIDLDLQKEASFLLEGKVGAIVALDPRDGAIRALASAPSYDPNLFTKRLAETEWRSIVDSPNHPLQNRAIQNAYAPGSVFKVVMGTAALSEGVVDPSRKVFCNGSVKIYDRRRRCWKAGGHGWVDLHNAIKQSCDVYFYVVGRDLGIDAIARYAHQFGFGRPTGIELPGERSGLVPDEAYRTNRGTPWYAGETISVAIGQGPVLTTPLQVAEVMAVAANGGHRVIPYLVAGRAAPPEPLPFDEAALGRVREALRAVVNDEKGSGARARVSGLTVAGKTGTAQVVEQKTWTRSASLPWEQRDHAWFASFAPFEDPELVVVVFIEHGGLGSQAAAPLAKAMYEKYLDLDPDLDLERRSESNKT